MRIRKRQFDAQRLSARFEDSTRPVSSSFSTLEARAQVATGSWRVNQRAIAADEGASLALNRVLRGSVDLAVKCPCLTTAWNIHPRKPPGSDETPRNLEPIVSMHAKAS